MTRSCSALGCSARDNGRSRERGISFHQFPVDAAQRREWIRAVNRLDPRSRRAWSPGPGAILCSRHFAEADFERYGLRRKLRRGAVPSRFPLAEPPRGHPRKVPLRSALRSQDHTYSRSGAGPVSPAAGPRRLCGPVRKLAARRGLPRAALRVLRALFPDLPRGARRWRRPAEYCPAMRRFACLLHLRHRTAYEQLRKVFPLPHPASLTNWLSNDAAAPGFSNDIFLQLQEKVERGEQAYCYCALMVQEMSLQKCQEWDRQTQHLTGFIDFGAGSLDADEAPLASEAVVVMAAGISSPWRAPLGYFFVSSMTGCLLAQLLRQAISKLNNVGVTVLAVTSGATAYGAETARALGVRINPQRIRCAFHHPPSSTHCIAYFFDVCHALQLIRNTLQCFQKIQWLSDTVQWQHVVELATLQEKKLLGLRSGHTESEETYQLKVNLAAQLFSEGVADALEHLQKLGLASFQNCGGTVKFLRMMSCLCDVFHGRGPYGSGLKGPLLARNYNKISPLFHEAKSFFVTLTDSTGRYIIKSKRRLGFLSFLLNAESLKWLCSNPVLQEGAPSHCLLTSAFSLDPLEQFFSALRQACSAGSGNPTCAMFQAAYRKVLAGCSLAPDTLHSTAHISSLDLSLSHRTGLTLGSICSQYNPAHRQMLAAELPCAGLLLCDSSLSNALTDLSLHKQSITFAAGLVAEQLASNLQCEACVASLFESDRSRLRCGAVLYIKKLHGLSLPSASVHRVAYISEQVLSRHRQLGDDNKNSKLCYLSLEQKIFHELLGQNHLFPSLPEHLCEGELHPDNHYTILVKGIAECYLNIRTNQAQKLNFSYHCGRHRLKRVKGKHLVPITAR
ncbi:DNA transposase THAP9 isoform X2 [Phasianus colchicus]|uniref:DNA transposase THAP9 isoform X2 n=1 Tax=Phasianus colchicus TaxID=9054 RepID=UPI00129DF23C|nr:DNA transposase THAP9 isoform X2 [Phasianus colchicus]